MLDAFREVAAGLTYAAPTLTVISDLTGKPATDEELRSADYWVAHARGTVRFADGIRAAHAHGAATFLELGPDSVLSSPAQDTLGDGTDADFVPLLRADRGEERSVTSALARLHVRGTAVDWPAYFTGTGARTVDLPTYAFQHERYWPEAAPARGPQAAADPADAELWSAVERGDAAGLAGLLGLRDEQHASLYALLPALSSWRQLRQEKALLDSTRYRVAWRPVRRPPPRPGRHLAGRDRRRDRRRRDPERAARPRRAVRDARAGRGLPRTRRTRRPPASRTRHGTAPGRRTVPARTRRQAGHRAATYSRSASS
ncbi:acyltransferase domain-containing protein [Streptomyces stramineus]